MGRAACGRRDACDGSPLIDGDLLYVCTSNGVDREASVAYADNPQDARPRRPQPDRAGQEDRPARGHGRRPHIGPNMLHGQWSSPTLGVVDGRKLVFFGGGDGVCYAFEALAGVPQKPVKLKTVWSFDCNPPEYKSFGGLDGPPTIPWATGG